MRLKNFAVAVLVCLGAIACRASHADTMSPYQTLTLKSTSGQSVGGVYVYPYNLSINGSTQTVSMMCINYNDEVTVGETWQVTQQQLSTSSSAALQEDAWIYSQLSNSKYSTNDVQFAIWDILDPGVGGNPGYSNDMLAQQLVSLAQGAVSAGLSNSFLNQYTVFSPVLSNQAGWTAGTPQSFIVNSSAVTPEPSSLLLLGTGLLGSSLLLMRRRALQESRPESL